MAESPLAQMPPAQMPLAQTPLAQLGTPPSPHPQTTNNKAGGSTTDEVTSQRPNNR
ncbi:MAG: hypothetical protein GY816_17375 [Cytophagales bacterium]|nr:hypothetical protein [Cytophagales bacterium]